MGSQEVNELNASQSKQRLTMIGIAVAVVLGIGIGIWMMGDKDKHQEFSVGAECSGDCGVYRHQGWICLKDRKYCTRPCGENHPECPEGFTCQEVPGAPATTPKGAAEPHSNYCLK